MNAMYIHLPNNKEAVKIGERVILGRHDMNQTWFNEMEKYVGLIATITSYVNADYYGKHRFTVDIDGGVWTWRVENMRLATDVYSQFVQEPAICSECHSRNIYIEHRPGFLCKICKSWKEYLGT
jgi:hypothetical protein